MGSFLLALTQGDPAGIGPDIALMAWMKRTAEAIPPFLYIGDHDILAERARLLGLSVPIEAANETTAPEIFGRALPVLALPTGARVAPGKPDSATATGTIGAIERGVELALTGRVAGVVTNPIAKSVLYEAGDRKSVV